MSVLFLFARCLFVLCLLAVSLFASGVSSYAQDKAALGETVTELPQAIWHVFQAKNGHHWFGSDGQGVFRYDGKTLTRFSTKDGLPHDAVRGIQEDKVGNIYITTNGGFSQFDGVKFATLVVSSDSGKGWKLGPDDVWLSAGAPYRYDGKTLYRLQLPTTELGEAWIAKHPKDKFPFASSPYDIFSMYQDRKGNMWFGTGAAGVCFYDGKSFGWIEEKDVTEYHYGPANGVRSILEDKEGKFWLGNSQFRYEIPEDSIKASDASAASAKTPKRSEMKYTREKGIGSLDGAADGGFYEYMSAVKDDAGELWIATYGGGVFRYDGKKLTPYPVMAGDQVITLISIYRDHRGDLWLGTHEHGALKFNGKRFERFRVK
jgi:ligand-binding sensor domain-containing protein